MQSTLRDLKKIITIIYLLMIAINTIGSTIYSTFLLHNLILEKQSLIPEFQMELLQPTHNFKQNKYGYFEPLLFLFQ